MTDRTLRALLRSLRRDVDSLQRRLTRSPYSLPARLSPAGVEVSDWNDVRAVGFYWSASDAANSPDTGAAVGAVYAGDGGATLIQEARIVDGPAILRRGWQRRSMDGGATWGAWATVGPRVLTGVASVTGVGTHQVEAPVAFPASFFSASPVVLVGSVGTGSASGTLVGSALDPTVTGFTLRLKTAQGNNFSQPYSVPWHATQT